MDTLSMEQHQDDKIAASLIIHDADRMTPDGRRQIAAWLRRQASGLIKDGDRYAKRFRARYLCAGSLH
jgi:hypothetical protein